MTDQPGRQSPATDPAEPAEGPRPPAVSELLDTKTILDEQAAGRAAYRAGHSVTTCPHTHGPDDEEPDETQRRKVRRLMWVRGYSHAQHEHQDPAGE